jgi:glutaredoxin
MTRTGVFVAVTLALAAGAASAQLYRWTDEQGKVHVTDTPPPPGAKNVQKKAVAAPAPAAPAEPYALTLVRKQYPIKLFTTPDCEGCDLARKLLNARGLPFDEVSVTTQQQLTELKEQAGTGSVPAMIVGSTVQKGFEETAYNKLLDAAGYPKAGVLPPRDQKEPARPGEPKVEIKPVAGAEEEKPRGPYAGKPPAVPEPEIPAPYKPGAPKQRETKKK